MAPIDIFCFIMGRHSRKNLYLLHCWPKLAEIAASLVQSLRSGDVNSAKQICASGKPQISEVFVNAMDTKRPRELAERMTERSRVRLMSRLKRNLWILGTIGSASPFVGLLGTVVGIVRAFHDMAEKGAGGFSVVAGGISEALIATELDSLWLLSHSLLTTSS